MNIYEATVIDRMHHLDLGLFKHQINFTCSLLKEKYGASILDTIDNRLANIPRFPELKIFKNGIQSLARITANEYRNLMKVMIFVLDNLDIDESIQNKLLKLYGNWNNIYLLSRYEEFTDGVWRPREVSKLSPQAAGLGFKSHWRCFEKIDLCSGNCFSSISWVHHL